MTKRSDLRLNTHQRLQLQGWRANCDIQVVIDHYACVEYLTKYAASYVQNYIILCKILCKMLTVILTLIELLKKWF